MLTSVRRWAHDLIWGPETPRPVAVRYVQVPAWSGGQPTSTTVSTAVGNTIYWFLTNAQGPGVIRTVLYWYIPADTIEVERGGFV